MHYKVATHGEFETLNPDGFHTASGEDAGVDYWDNLLQCTPDYETPAEELLGPLKRMPKKYRRLYNLFYVCNLTRAEICEMEGYSWKGIEHQLRTMREWLRKELRKDELGRKLGTNGQKGDL